MFGLKKKAKTSDYRKVKIASFVANDADIAQNFMRKLERADEHGYDIDEVTTDHFEMFFVIHDVADRDGDIEEAVKVLNTFSKSELTMQGIFNFTVERGKERELN